MERTQAKAKAIFRSVKDTPEERGVCGFRRRMITDEENEAANVTFLRVHDSKMHYHRGMTEFYYVLRGGGTITLDGEKKDIAAGDLVVIKPRV